MNEHIMHQVGFTNQVNAIKHHQCPFCYIEVNILDFRNELSRKEFTISGLCQSCQDSVFGKD